MTENFAHELERKTRELGIVDRVIFTGFRKDTGELYADLDLVALTSLNEGTPVTLIEAMCAGRAVIATEVGGVRDLMGELAATDRGDIDLVTWRNDTEPRCRQLRRRNPVPL